MASQTLNIIDSSATVFKDLVSLDSVSFNNKTKSIAWDLPDSYINTRLLIDRIYMNNYDCYVNTKRGNFILDSHENWIHMVFYEKRWNCVNRVNALPFTPDVINRQDISLNIVGDQGFGSNILVSPLRNSNNGSNGKFYMSNKLFVSAPRYLSTKTGENGVGGIYVYDATTNSLEDFITIPYYNYLGTNQGNFGTQTCILPMTTFGYDYLIVSAPARKKQTTDTLLSIFLFTYWRKTDGSTFYFQNETLADKEIVVNTTKTLRDIKSIPNFGFLLIFDDEIIRYNILNTANQSAIVSSGFKLNAGSLISDSSLTIRSVDTYVDSSLNYLVFILYSNNVIYRFNASSDRNSLINLGPCLAPTPQLLKILILQINTNVYQIVANSTSSIYYYSLNNNTPTNTYDVSGTVVSYDVNSLGLAFIDSLNVRFYDSFNFYNGSNMFSSLRTNMTSETFNSNTKILINKASGKLFTGGFNSGKVWRLNEVAIGSNLTVDVEGTITFQENTVETLLFSDDSEILYAFHPITKILYQFNRNSNNDYEFVQTILPSQDLKKVLGYLDTVFDVKLDVANLSLFISFLPSGTGKTGKVVGVNVMTTVIEVLFSGVTDTFGKSIALSKTGRYLVVGEPSLPSMALNGLSYKRGGVHVYDAINKNVARFNVLRSTQCPIGNLVKFSPSENEILTIGARAVNTDLDQVVCFTNIFESIYRTCVYKYIVNDATYLYDGQVVVSTNELINGKQIYHVNQKINGCFEINTQKDITLGDITDVTSLKVYPLGERFVFFVSLNGTTGTVTLMDMTGVKKIQKISTQMNTNITYALDGTGFAHGYKSNGLLTVSFYA